MRSSAVRWADSRLAYRTSESRWAEPSIDPDKEDSSRGTGVRYQQPLQHLSHGVPAKHITDDGYTQSTSAGTNAANEYP